MGSSMRLTPWKRREGYQSWLEEFARFLQEKETVTGDKCMALLEEQKRKGKTGFFKTLRGGLIFKYFLSYFLVFSVPLLLTLFVYSSSAKIISTQKQRPSHQPAGAAAVLFAHQEKLQALKADYPLFDHRLRPRPL